MSSLILGSNAAIQGQCRPGFALIRRKRESVGVWLVENGCLPSEVWWMRMCGSVCVDVQNVSIGVWACAFIFKKGLVDLNICMAKSVFSTKCSGSVGTAAN